MTDLMTVAKVRKAPGCPHYITENRFLEMVALVGGTAIGTIRCRFCYDRPVVTYGVFDKPGRSSNHPRVNRRAARPQRREMAERGRVA